MVAADGIRTSDVQKDTRNTDRTMADKCNTEAMEAKPCRDDGLKQEKTPSRRTVMSDRYFTADCDVCKLTKDIEEFLYCHVCKQKFCNMCAVIHNRLGGTRHHSESTGKCWLESEIVDKDLVDIIMKEQRMNLEQLTAYIIEELGIQVSFLYEEEILEIRTPFPDILPVAIETLHAMAESDAHSLSKRVRHGAIEWRLMGQCAKAVVKLFQNEINSLIETYDVVANINGGSENFAWSRQRSGCTTESKTMGTYISTYLPHTGNQMVELILSSSFENFYAVDCEIGDIKDEAQTLLKVEILRPKQDVFRINMYTILQEKNDVVICHVEKLENMQKLVIQGREASAVENVKQEFLSLFCKECSSCHEESSRPTFLECKHVLCNDCVNKSESFNAELRCPLCSDRNREKTPVKSLQLQCIQAIDELLEKDSGTKQSVHISRRKSSLRTRQLSTKIPKYLLSKWKKMTGGLTRLKSMIENNYGFKVAGTDDNIRIYGEQQEILDLAVQSLERLNEKTPQTGITQRLAEKCVEWRFRGDHARITQFLFSKELHDLKKKFRTVTIQVFMDSDPTIVDVKCGYGEFLKVRYDMEELENDLKNLYTDECIQPKNFYHNVKIKEYLQSKRRDSKVHCTLVEKNNLNAVVICGRKKEYVNAAKEQLLKW